MPARLQIGFVFEFEIEIETERKALDWCSVQDIMAWSFGHPLNGQRSVKEMVEQRKKNEKVSKWVMLPHKRIKGKFKMVREKCKESAHFKQKDSRGL